MADPSTYRPRPGEIPVDPGVYRFRDKDGRVIYVGKAKSLRPRLSSYLFSSLDNRVTRHFFTEENRENEVFNHLCSLRFSLRLIRLSLQTG